MASSSELDPEKYLNERVIGQQKWYSKEAGKLKKWYTRLKIAVIVLAAFIPFATGLIKDFEWIQYLIGFVSVAIVIIEGILSLHKHQEKWIDYRGTSEALKREINFFQYQMPPYNDPKTAFPLFFVNIETILGDQNQQWREIVKKDVEVKTEQGK